ncbi:uncharacterized protein [Procambarus clarkii]|uniref:uncharacterized protein n=1 Tax=Procambarus clarkii TaxID=6728 RepID=UPI003742D740
MGRQCVRQTLLWLWCWSSTAHLVTSTIMNDNFFKVSNPTFPSLSGCSLSTWPVTKTLYCAALCQRNPRCTLFCLSEGACQLYQARVGRNWAADVGTLMAGSCYSNWGSTIMNNVSVTAPLNANSAYGIDGFYCNDFNYIFCSQSMANAYYAVSLGTLRAVTSVKICTFYGYFSDVEVRVGNSSSYSTAFAANTLLGSYPGSVHDYTVITFTAAQPIVGIIVSVLQKTNGFLCFGDLQVFAL